MRFIRLLILAVMLMISASRISFGEQLLLHGVVQSVDMETRSLILFPDLQAHGGKQVHVKLAEILDVPQEIRNLVQIIQPGKHLRVWGTFREGGKVFNAFRIRSCQARICDDPTGVRSRLSRKSGKAGRAVYCWGR